eukprot:scaffold32841_cov19-Tisochrysis_lutea.AAC.2
MVFSEDMRQACSSSWQQAVQHQFTKELKEKSLAPDVFARYLLQVKPPFCQPGSKNFNELIYGCCQTARAEGALSRMEVHLHHGCSKDKTGKGFGHLSRVQRGAKLRMIVVQFFEACSWADNITTGKRPEGFVPAFRQLANLYITLHPVIALSEVCSP